MVWDIVPVGTLFWHPHDQHPGSPRGTVTVAGTTEVALVMQQSEERDEISEVDLEGVLLRLDFKDGGKRIIENTPSTVGSIHRKLQ